ncbi:MAG: transporter, family, multidrug resistance protein [Thermomicrobiales bacterium]|jgi:DHA1 family multidrug resistance protein-like MFS transporter|nr:transporter, family, multidrug resistance protein [Thermomicrobiales bacterium]
MAHFALRTKLKRAPDDRPVTWRRNLYALVVAQAFAIVGFGLRDAFLPFYLKGLGNLDNDQAALWSGFVAAGGAGVMAITAPLWGIVSDRRGRKPMVLRAMFAATLTVGFMGIATAPWHLLGLRLVEGAFTGTVTASTALVAASAPKDKLGYSLGLISMAVFSGASLGPFLGGVLADWIGYRATFGVSAAMLASAGVIVLFFVRERFTPPVRAPRGPERGLAAFRASTSWMMAPMLVTMIAVLFVVRLAQMGVRPIMPLYVEELGHYDDKHAASVAGIAFGLLGLTSAFSSVYLGRRGDRVGHRKILVGCTLGAGLIYLPMALVRAPWQLVVLQGLFGVAAGGLIPAANAIVANATPGERRGFIYGITAGASSLGGFFGPLAGAAIAASLGFSAAFVSTAVLLLLLTAAVAYAFGGKPSVVGRQSSET